MIMAVPLVIIAAIIGFRQLSNISKQDKETGYINGQKKTTDESTAKSENSIPIQDLKNYEILTTDLAHLQEKVQKRTGFLLFPEISFMSNRDLSLGGLTIFEDSRLSFDVQKSGLLYFMVSEKKLLPAEAQQIWGTLSLEGRSVSIKDVGNIMISEDSAGKRILSFIKNDVLIQIKTAAKDFVSQNPGSYVSDNDLLEFAKSMR